MVQRGPARKKMKSRKKKKITDRNFLVPAMRAHCKPGPHTDKKKEASRRACRNVPKAYDDPPPLPQW
jgi:hypothetical protein